MSCERCTKIRNKLKKFLGIEPKFNIGDQVKHIPTGKIGTIEAFLYDSGVKQQFVALRIGDRYWNVALDLVTKVEEE